MTQTNTLTTAVQDPSESIWREMVRELRKGSDQAAKAHLAAGEPVYYSDDDTPPGLVIKLYPDDRRELVRFDADGEHFVRGL